MRAKYLVVGLIGVLVGVLLSSAVVVLAGNLDPSSGPTDAASQMYTLEQVYQRLETGAAGTKMTSFTEPANGPGTGTMHTLDQVYDLIGMRAPVPETGQIAKHGDRDDGDLEKGVAWPRPRFTDNGDGTVTDHLTGLIWLQDANCIATQYPVFDQDFMVGDGQVTWAHAILFVTGINAGTYLDCGEPFTDWRLPNLRELQSLVHYGFHAPAVPNTEGTGQWSEGVPFLNVQSKDYWSSTTLAEHSGFAWYMYLGNGALQNDDKSITSHVWPVRDGQ